MENLYHLYFDEGGILGDATVLITSKKLRISKTENHISWYYVGKLTNSAITTHLERFKQLFPTCKINHTKKIEVNFKERLKFPREMLVSKDGESWRKEIIHAKIPKVKRPYAYAWFGWEFAKEIE